MRSDEWGHGAGSRRHGARPLDLVDVAGGEAAYHSVDERGDPLGGSNLGTMVAARNKRWKSAVLLWIRIS
jgi:hypothetical protein